MSGEHSSFQMKQKLRKKPEKWSSPKTKSEVLLIIYRRFISRIKSTYGRWRESLVQCAAVKTYFLPINEPPHQNSTRLSPCKKIAAIHGHSPDSASRPPTTRPAQQRKDQNFHLTQRLLKYRHFFETSGKHFEIIPVVISCWPHWPSSMKLPVTSFNVLAGSNGFGGRETVCTGSRGDGRLVVVVVVVVVVSGVKINGGLWRIQEQTQNKD